MPAPDTPTPDMAAFRAGSAGYLSNHLARLFAAELTAALAPLGLAPAQFMTLLELWAEEGLTQADLVARLDVEQATMAQTLARMERDGLVTRAPHPTDRRARVVVLSDRARDLRAPALAAAGGVNARAERAIGPARMAALVEVMGDLVAALRRR